MDFTLRKYRMLLMALKGCRLPFIGFSDLNEGTYPGFIVLRHDVDKKPCYALKMARAEAEEGIRASYHFRAGSNGFEEKVISAIAGLGHETAYHYEDLTAVLGKLKARILPPDPGVIEKAAERYRQNLARLRTICPVQVISMHGSPLSPVDNRLLWKYHDYHADGITCEPYFDIDMSDVLYLTDTGRRWDGDESSIRDRGIQADSGTVADSFEGWRAGPVNGSLMAMTPEGIELKQKYSVRSTDDLIALARMASLPRRLIINTHPQRWSDGMIPWFIELIFQNLKNPVKKAIIKSKYMS